VPAPASTRIAFADNFQNEQRQRRKDEASSGNGWAHRHFTHVDSDPEYQQLSAMLHDKLTPAHEDAYVYKGEQQQAQAQAE
jgi:hypothetical protein